MFFINIVVGALIWMMIIIIIIPLSDSQLNTQKKHCLYTHTEILIMCGFLYIPAYLGGD